MHKGFQVLVIQILMFVAGLMITSCSKDEDNTPTGPTSPWQAENSTCVSSVCHGNANLSKSIVVTGGATEVVPLYVDSVEFLATVHRARSVSLVIRTLNPRAVFTERHPRNLVAGRASPRSPAQCNKRQRIAREITSLRHQRPARIVMLNNTIPKQRTSGFLGFIRLSEIFRGTL